MHVHTDVNVCVRLWCPVPGWPGWHLFWGDSTAAGGEAGNLCAWAEGGPPGSSGSTIVPPMLGWHVPALSVEPSATLTCRSYGVEAVIRDGHSGGGAGPPSGASGGSASGGDDGAEAPVAAAPPSDASGGGGAAEAPVTAAPVGGGGAGPAAPVAAAPKAVAPAAEDDADAAPTARPSCAPPGRRLSERTVRQQSAAQAHRTQSPVCGGASIAAPVVGPLSHPSPIYQ